MRVALGVDALEPEPGGIGRYTWELCKGLRQQKSLTSLRFIARNRIVDDPGRLMRGEQDPRRTYGTRAVRSWFDRQILRSHLVHGPNYFLPAFAETGIITIHDLSVFRFPDTHPAERIRAFEREFAASVGKAAHIITDTETIRRELINDFGVSAERVSAVWLGVDARFRSTRTAEISAALNRLQLRPHGYALCISTLEPRKQIGELLTAWRMLPRSVRDRYPLVLAGGKGWRNEQLKERVAKATREGWLRHLGFVEEDVLPALYAGAALFVYPSMYEGFGLPPLEAMASGVPVVVSYASCLPEVCGDAALYVDPSDVVGFARVLETILNDPEHRAHLIKKSVARSHLFGWDRCIQGTVSAYQQAIARIGAV